MTRVPLASIAPLAFATLLGVSACNAGDLSASLATGRCDASGQCAPGYVCEPQSWQCTAVVALSSGGTHAVSSPTGLGGTTPVVSSGGAASPNGGSTSLSGASSIGGTASTVSSSGASAGYTGAPSGGASGGATASSSGGIAATGGAPATGGSSAAGGITTVDAAACTQDGCPCANGWVICGGECVDLASSPQHCGTCSNRCDLSASALACGQTPRAGCSCAGDDTKCGDNSTTDKCLATTGACQCNGNGCVVGEVCLPNKKGVATCSCDGAGACSATQACCQGSGCVNLKTSESDCGFCGLACPTGFHCNGGGCQCVNKAACDAGGGGDCSPNGFCLCGNATCSAGQRCLASGQCG